MTRRSTDWTDEQKDVIEAPADSKMLVVADAGTGKTEVLIARLDGLIKNGNIAPGEEILTVSFTRAAVGEIKDRLRADQGPARYATVSTFDSYATRLLSRHDPTDAWSDGGYDARIASATELIHTSEGAQEELARLKHFFVDEIQDLVGVRLEFVQAILTHLDHGFTLLGDPAQAIYNWQVKGRPSDGVFDWLRDNIDDLDEKRLTKNFRAQTKETRRVLEIGHRLNEPNPPYGEIADELLTLARDLPAFTSMTQLAATLKRAEGATAVLTRTNGQALVISEGLWERGIAHQLRGDATDRVVQPWIGRIMVGLGAAVLTKSRFFKRAFDGGIDGDLEQFWTDLKRMDPGRGDSVAVDSIRRRIIKQYVPDRLCIRHPDPVTVSTIHRAKGLEFRNAVITEPNGYRFGDEDPADETRTLYVAMTRPRRHIMTLSDQDMHWVRNDQQTKRWIRRGPKVWMTFGFELRGDDVHRLHPGGGYVFDDDSVEIQEYLWTSVEMGDAVTLHLVGDVKKGETSVPYTIVHNDRPIGVTSERFGEILGRRIGRGRPPKGWPQEIGGLRIEAVDTVAGTTAVSQKNGLGSAGIWIRPRIVGLGRFEW